jgi:branched-chain amino acid transport system ATP-binding protein
MSLLTIDSITVQYGELRAVDRVSLSLDKGELVLLLGSNGAGKSSLMKAIIGLVDASAGEVALDGETLGSSSTSSRIRRGIGYVPEGRGVFPSLTVAENVLTGLLERDDRQAMLERSFELFPRLGERRNQVAGSLSGGEQQMVSLARALAGGPRVLLLDEPSLGLAPAIVSGLFATVARLRDDGMTILLVEQFAHAALQIADRATVMVRGQLTAPVPAEQLRALSAEDLAQRYFNGLELAVPSRAVS